MSRTISRLECCCWQYFARRTNRQRTRDIVLIVELPKIGISIKWHVCVVETGFRFQPHSNCSMCNSYILDGGTRSTDKNHAADDAHGMFGLVVFQFNFHCCRQTTAAALAMHQCIYLRLINVINFTH